MNWINLTDKLRELGDNQRRLKDTMWTTRYREFDDGNLVKKVSSRNICKIFNQGTHINLLHPRALEYLNELKKEFGSAYADWVDSLNIGTIISANGYNCFDISNIRIVSDGLNNWINLNNCANEAGASRQKLNAILKSKGFNEYLAEWEGRKKYLTLQESMIKVVESTEETELFKRGTYLNTNTDLGKSLFLYIAQSLSPRFHIWCNAHIQNILDNGYSVSNNASHSQLSKLQKDLNHYMNLHEQDQMTIQEQKEKIQSLKAPHYERTICDAFENQWKHVYEIERQPKFQYAGAIYEPDFILSNKIIIEVKRIEKWSDAIGQVGKYETVLKKIRGTSSYEKWVLLFGETIDDETRELVLETAQSMRDCKVIFMVDVNQLPDRR